MLVDVKFTLLSLVFSVNMQNLLAAEVSKFVGWQLRGQLTLVSCVFIHACKWAK